MKKITFFSILILSCSITCAQEVLSENEFGFGLGFARDYNNSLFPRFPDNLMPEEYVDNWADDPVIEGRMISFSWYFRLDEKIPLKIEYFRGEFREQYSDPLMLWSTDKFDKLYNSIVLGSYWNIIKKESRHQIRLDYGLNFYRIFNSIARYEIDIDENGDFISVNPYVENSYENNITLNAGFQYKFYSKNEKVSIGLKVSGFYQIDYHQNFTGWTFLPTISYTL
ncbi:hypothetical protein ABWH96_19365 [Marivirga tractuosa]|uniref:hypothetical protein n=1 Tax=Marivirga tractuosa TaxID=1006 RepID=UPI0035D1134A